MSNKDRVNKNYNFQDDIMLDSASTVDIFMKPDIVDNVRESKSILEMATNAVCDWRNKEASFIGYGTVWFEEDDSANIFSLSQMVKKKGWHVTYDSAVGDASYVFSPDPDDSSRSVIRKFKQTPQGLYAYTVKTEGGKCHLIDAVTERRKKYCRLYLNYAIMITSSSHSTL